MGIFNKRNTSLMIVDYILDKIEKRELKKGDKMMTEREFSEQFGVSRVPLREALCALSLLGILRSRQGEGTYVSSVNPDLLGKLFYSYAILENSSLSDIIEVRMVLEAQAAKLATQNATADDISHISKAMNVYKESAQRGEVLSAERLDSANKEFHQALTLATHNDFLILQLNATASTFNELYLASFQSEEAHAHRDVEKSWAEHYAIGKCVLERDAEGASEHMRCHMERLRQIVTE